MAGPYLLGYTIGCERLELLLGLEFWVHLLFFTFPVNLLLYGINDLFDADTDSLNPKKGSVEHRLSESDRPLVLTGVAVAAALALILAAGQKSRVDAAMLLLFVALALAYSTPPVRLKARPIVDSASNVLYAVPGFLGWQQASGRAVPIEAVVTAGFWTGAMHLFSAIPDIKSDSEAGIATTATVLGFRGSLACCAVLWLVFALSLLTLDSMWPWTIGLLVYPAVPVFLLFLGSEATTRVYWRFPAINSLLGMAGFFVIALSK